MEELLRKKMEEHKAELKDENKKKKD